MIDNEILDYLKMKLWERGKLYGLGDVIRELVEENKRLREELKACRELLM
jgi:hypothetical protein